MYNLNADYFTTFLVSYISYINIIFMFYICNTKRKFICFVTLYLIFELSTLCRLSALVAKKN